MKREHHYYVYIMASRSRILYIGMTNSLFKRVGTHKLAEEDGFTKRYRICRLVYFESFKYVNNAIERETQLKKWARAKKLALIESTNPSWHDLAEHLNAEVQIPRFARNDN